MGLKLRAKIGRRQKNEGPKLGSKLGGPTIRCPKLKARNGEPKIEGPMLGTQNWGRKVKGLKSWSRNWGQSLGCKKLKAQNWEPKIGALDREAKSVLRREGEARLSVARFLLNPTSQVLLLVLL